MPAGYLGVGSTNLMPPKMIQTSPIKSYLQSSSRIVKELGMNSEHLNISDRFALRVSKSCYDCPPRVEAVEEPEEKLMSPFLVEDHHSNRAGDQSLSLSPFLVQRDDIELEDMKKLMEIFIQSDFQPLGLNDRNKKPKFNYQTTFHHQTSRLEVKIILVDSLDLSRGLRSLLSKANS